VYLSNADLLPEKQKTKTTKGRFKTAFFNNQNPVLAITTLYISDKMRFS